MSPLLIRAGSITTSHCNHRPSVQKNAVPRRKFIRVVHGASEETPVTMTIPDTKPEHHNNLGPEFPNKPVASYLQESSASVY